MGICAGPVQEKLRLFLPKSKDHEGFQTDHLVVLGLN